MPLTKEQRIEYLKKAREAKALRRKNDLSQLKIDESKQSKVEPEPIIEPVKVVEKPNKLRHSTKSLDLTIIKDKEPIPPPTKVEIENDEVIEVIEEVVKIKKPKRIIKKIIKQQYESDTDEEIIEEVIKPTIQPKYKQKTNQPQIKPKQDDITMMLFNY